VREVGERATRYLLAERTDPTMLRHVRQIIAEA